ncbi:MULTISPECIES: hypothetical protein [Streptomyces]|uniref:hypothetical protein n=1 Tax=Streptomyces TaxID=1883 RepID=UPI001D13A9CE|nr:MULTISPECIES: hypothetical protein [Streptomyces]MCC3653486.1 hypothetical protein [Streptomyces sp. S07_1.15]WSQ71976.1 hypothetical protein OG463_11315 [Streptomyces xinghaiensis]
MAPTKSKRRPAVRRAGESAYGLLLVGKQALMAAVALLVLIAGVFTSWDAAQHAMLTKGRERGTVTIERCDGDVCGGRFEPAAGAPAGADAERRTVTVVEAAGRERGERLPVAVKPGTDEAVRTGLGGVLHAWIPFAGALLLAALVVAGGLRMRRTAWWLGLAGAALLGGAFLTL